MACLDCATWTKRLVQEAQQAIVLLSSAQITDALGTVSKVGAGLSCVMNSTPTPHCWRIDCQNWHLDQGNNEVTPRGRHTLDEQRSSAIGIALLLPSHLPGLWLPAVCCDGEDAEGGIKGSPRAMGTSWVGTLVQPPLRLNSWLTHCLACWIIIVRLHGIKTLSKESRGSQADS